MRRLHIRFAWLILFCLLFSMWGCLSTEALPTLVIKPSQVTGLITPTQRPPNSAPIQNTSTPQPTPTAPASSLLPQVQILCAAAFSSAAPASNATSLPAPFVSSIFRSYNEAGWVYEQTLAHLETRDASQVAALVCIRESRVQQGEYQNGAPAYRLDWEVRFLQWPDGTQLAGWTEPGSPVRGVILAGESAGYGEPPRDALLQTLASASDNRSLIFLEKAVSGLAFSPDGKVLYISETAPSVSSYTGGAEEMGVRIWSLADWRAGELLGGPGHVAHPDSINAFALSAGGGRMAAGRWSGLVQVWDTSSLTQAAQFQTGRQGFYGPLGLAFSPDEALLAALGEDKVMVWNVETQELLWQRSVVTRPGRTAGLAFQPDGQSLAVSMENETVSFASRDGASLGQVTSGPINQLIFTPDGKFLWYRDELTGPYAFNLAGGPAKQLKPGIPLGEGICSMALSSDSTYLAAGSCKGKVVIWRTDTGEALAVLSGHTMPVWALAFSPDGKILASGSDDRSVCLWFAGGDYPSLP